jgi:nitrite reductase/ring-hydroxylating ferredoxin subunit
MTMRFYPLEKLINLHDSYTRQFKIDSHRMLLLQRRGELFLIESHCPHREHPLDVATVDNGLIQCALHQYQFSIDDGRLIHATEEPCRGLRTYELIYEGNEVGLMLGD